MSSSDVPESAQVCQPREGHATERRMVRFDWSGTPAHWVPNDPFATHMINVLHLLLPAGERWFIDSVNQARPRIRDEELSACVTPFIQQEAWHAWAHGVVLRHLAEQGIDTTPYTDRLEKMFRRLLGDHPSWPAPMRRWWVNHRLGVVAALEHYTAVLGHWILTNRGLEEAGADPVMLDLLRWHGAEELEHRSLVFDVHEEVTGRRGYFQRVVTMLTTTPTFWSAWLLGVRFLLRQDPALDIRPSWSYVAREWTRAARQGRLPSPRELFSGVTRYMRPGYNPSQEFSTQLAYDYLSRSPAARAAAAHPEGPPGDSDGRASGDQQPGG